MAADKKTAAKKQVNPQINAPHTTAPKGSAETVAVGCKYPCGFHMDIREPGKPWERVTLKGTNSLQSPIIKISTIGGFAVTENVPKEFFERWLKLNSEHPGVKNGLIFHHEQTASVVDMGNEREKLLSGFDPIDPKKKIVDGRGRVLVEERTELD